MSAPPKSNDLSSIIFALSFVIMLLEAIVEAAKAIYFMNC